MDAETQERMERLKEAQERINRARRHQVEAVNVAKIGRKNAMTAVLLSGFAVVTFFATIYKMRPREDFPTTLPAKDDSSK
eukprot:tig00000852_g5040.t1